ncbi:RDS/peripherin-like protein xRDS35 [Copidosoma floridanum]|uniref:RDS/peripherin-like protein xRDS35 n=1 Tax=Copidosoma floridanum TaxID=29053 RepID=UPI000C6F9190|nr:RDS/peripherin-like protein xRDS35 [Copidosoma floridanum]
MGFPRARFSHRSLRRLAGWIFWLSLLGLGSSLGLAYWAHALKQRLGDHMDLALPTEGYLLPGTLGLAALLTLPCHLVGIALWPSLVKDFARRTCQSRGKKRVSRLLLLHAVLSCLSGWLVGGACAGGAYYFAQTRRRLGQGLRRAVRHYRDDGDVKARLDRLQVELSCCGSESFVDWFFVPWAKTDLGGGEDDDEDEETFDPENEESIEPQMQQRHLLQSQHRADPRLVPRDAYVYLASTDVPYSCCLAEVLQSCEHRNLFALATLSIATEGCRAKLLRMADQAGWEIFACLVALAIYQSHEEKECLVPDVDASRRTKSKKLCEEEESNDEKDEDEDAGDDEDSGSTISCSDDSSKGRCRGGASATVKYAMS